MQYLFSILIGYPLLFITSRILRNIFYYFLGKQIAYAF